MSSISKTEIPLIEATNKSLEGNGYLVDNFDKCEIEIVTWPKQGWRNIEEGTGNEGGTTEGPFETWWEKNILYGKFLSRFYTTTISCKWLLRLVS